VHTIPKERSDQNARILRLLQMRDLVHVCSDQWLIYHIQVTMDVFVAKGSSQYGEVWLLEIYLACQEDATPHVLIFPHIMIFLCSDTNDFARVPNPLFRLSQKLWVALCIDFRVNELWLQNTEPESRLAMEKHGKLKHIKHYGPLTQSITLLFRTVQRCQWTWFY